MARLIRLSEAIPDTAEKAGWWAIAFGVAGAFIALALNDAPLAVLYLIGASSSS
jgi:hypothetical protein